MKHNFPDREAGRICKHCARLLLAIIRQAKIKAASEGRSKDCSTKFRLILDGRDRQQQKQRPQKKEKPLQACPAGEVLNPGAAAGVQIEKQPGGRWNALLNSESGLTQSLVHQRGPPIALHDLVVPSGYVRSFRDLPERKIFSNYNYNADHACTLSEGGVLLAMMTAHQTVKLARYLVQSLKTGSVIIMTTFTLGLQDLVDDLQKACQRGVETAILADRRSSFGQTRDMITNLKTLKANGSDVRLVNGRDIQREYVQAGRNVPAGRGLMHPKSLFISDTKDFSGEVYVIVGSCNWTISSLCNFETSVLLQLTQTAATEWKETVLGWPFVKLTAELEREEELNRERKSNRRSRTCSPRRSP